MKKFFNGCFGKSGLSLFMLMLFCALIGITDGGVYAADAFLPPTGVEEVTPGVNNVGVHVDGKDITTEVVRNITDDILLTDYDRVVLKCFPDKTPLDTLMRYANNRQTNSLKVKWGATDIKPFVTETTVEYDAVDTVKSAEISVANPKIFHKTSTIRVDGVFGYENGGTVLSTNRNLMLYVTGVDAAANKITVIAANGPVQASGNLTDTYVPDIPLGTKLYRMGKAASEKDVKTTATGSVPTFEENYVQSFKCQVDVSKWYQKSDKTVEWDMKDMEEIAIFEWKMEMESSFLFGAKTELYDDDKDERVTTCDGVVNYIKKEFEYSSFNNNTIIDLTKAAFVGNSGSRKRILFAGSELVANISKIDYTKFKDISHSTKVVWGIEWNVIKTNFGSLYLISHEILDWNGWSANGIVIDPDFLIKYTFEAKHNQKIDLSLTGESNVDTSVTTEVCCPGLKYPTCHLLIKHV